MAPSYVKKAKLSMTAITQLLWMTSPISLQEFVVNIVIGDKDDKSH
ncbi:MAG: hypothetical protein U0X76_10530 [Bacteroidia bacterium]